MISIRLLFLLPVLLLVVACDGASDPAPDGGIDAGYQLESLAMMHFCARQETLMAEFAVKQDLSVSPLAIGTEWRRRCAVKARAAARGRMSFDESQTEACLREIEEMTLGEYFDRYLNSPSCMRVFTPLLPEGSPCYVDAECAGDSWCRGAPVDWELFAADNIVACEAGACERRVALGATCSSRNSCVAGAACNWETNRCEPLPKEGDPCLGLMCGRGLYCPRKSTATEPVQVCTARKTTGPCSQPDECAARMFCSDGGYSSSSVCTSWSLVGESCSSGWDCRMGASCVMGICRAGSKLSESCLDGLPCQEGICDSGVCIAFPRPGGSCESNSECAVGAMCASGTCVVCPP